MDLHWRLGMRDMERLIRLTEPPFRIRLHEGIKSSSALVQRQYVLRRFQRALMPTREGWELIHGEGTFREAVDEYIMVQLDVLEEDPHNLYALANLFYLVAGQPHRCADEQNEARHRLVSHIEASSAWVTTGIAAYLRLDGITPTDESWVKVDGLMQQAKVVRGLLEEELGNG